MNESLKIFFFFWEKKKGRGGGVTFQGLLLSLPLNSKVRWVVLRRGITIYGHKKEALKVSQENHLENERLEPLYGHELRRLTANAAVRLWSVSN